MSITITDLLKATKSIEVTLSDDLKININYKLSYMNTAWNEKFSKIGTEGITQATLLADIIDSWDVLDPKGKEYKPTAENIEKLGTIIQNAIWKSVWESSLPNLRKTASN